MGNSSSKGAQAAAKAARKYPKRSQTPSWQEHKASNSQTKSQASEHRTDVIEKDARDPDFMANLNRLGQVRVDHHMQTVRPEAIATSKLFQSRVQSEHEASAFATPRNRLHGASLSLLLDKRKAAHSQVDLERLADKYGVDVEVLERLSKFVSTPSVNGAQATRTVGQDGEEHVSVMAIWVEPALSGPTSPS